MRIARVGLFLLAVGWVGLAIAALGQGSGASSVVLAVLMAINAAALGGLGLLIAQDRLMWWLMTTGLLAVNALLSVTDETGLLDWLALAGSVVALGLVIAAWMSSRRS